MSLPVARQLLLLNTELPSSGTIGYVTLIQPPLVTAAPVTIDTGTDLITAGTSPNFVTGMRFRLGGTLPAIEGGTLSTSTDYFWISVSATTGRLATSLVNAQSNVFVNFTSAGSSVTITEQLLVFTDPMNVKLGRELPAGNGWTTRKAIADIGPAIDAGGFAQKSLSWDIVATGAGFTYRHYVTIVGGSATIGDTTGNDSFFASETSNVVMTAGNPRPQALRYRVVSP